MWRKNITISLGLLLFIYLFPFSIYAQVETRAPTVTVVESSEQFNAPLSAYKNVTANVNCDDSYIQGGTTIPGSGCNISSYKLKLFTTKPTSCPTNYSEYNLASPQPSLSKTVWYCATAKDNAGNVGSSDPREIRPGCRDQCIPNRVFACREPTVYRQGVQYSSSCGNFDSDSCLEWSGTGETCPPYACDTGFCKQSSGYKHTGHATVWHDLDRDGVIDQNEEGIPNVTLLSGRTITSGGVVWLDNSGVENIAIQPVIPSGWKLVSTICEHYNKTVTGTCPNPPPPATIASHIIDGVCNMPAAPDASNYDTEGCGYKIAFGLNRIGNNSPSISFPNPPTPERPTNSNLVTLIAEAADTYGVTEIQIFVDGNIVKRCTSASSTVGTATMSCSISKLYPSGVHTYYAIATNTAGNRTRTAYVGTTTNDPEFEVLAVVDTACQYGDQVQNGLISTPGGITGLFGNTSQQCVLAPRAAFVSYKIPSYSELFTTHFTQKKESTIAPTLIKKEVPAGPGDSTESVLTFNETKLIHIAGNLTINANPPVTDAGPGVVFVDGNLNFANNYSYGKTSLRDSSGTLFVVKGNVIIASNVSEINAVIIAQGFIYTAGEEGFIYTAGEDCQPSSVQVSNQLVINGSLISLDEQKPIRFCRKLDPNPAKVASEKMNQQPKYLSILRNIFATSLLKWTEIPGFSQVPSGGAPVRPPTEPADLTPDNCYVTVNNRKLAYSRDGHITASPVAPFGSSYAISGTMPNSDTFDLYVEGVKKATLNSGEYYIWTNTGVVGDGTSFEIRSGTDSCSGRVVTSNFSSPACGTETTSQNGNFHVSVIKDTTYNPNTWPIYTINRDACTGGGDPTVSLPTIPTLASADNLQSNSSAVLAVSTVDCSANPSRHDQYCCGTTNIQNESACIKNSCVPTPVIAGSPPPLPGAVIILEESKCGHSYVQISNQTTFIFISMPTRMGNRVGDLVYNITVLPPPGAVFTRAACYKQSSGNYPYEDVVVLPPTNSPSAPVCGTGVVRGNPERATFGFYKQPDPPVFTKFEFSTSADYPQACFRQGISVNLTWTGDPLPGTDTFCPNGVAVEGSITITSDFQNKTKICITTTSFSIGLASLIPGGTYTKGQTAYVRINNGKNSNVLTFTIPTNDCPETIRSFISSHSFSGGDLGGLTGADQTCQTLADANGSRFKDSGSTWKAWLSTSATSAKSRFKYAPDTVFTNVATNLADLLDGSISSSIRFDEKGTERPNNTVWTGTQINGTSAGNSCNNWSSAASSFHGAAGHSSMSDNFWTNWNHLQCYYPGRIYCFETPKRPYTEPVNITALPTNACFPVSGGYTALLLWAGDPIPTTTDDSCKGGYWVDLSKQSTFGVLGNIDTGYIHKCVPTGTSISLPGGFASGLTLEKGQTYYARVYNSNLSNVINFTVPNDVCTLQSGLVAYWKMDEPSGTTTVADTSGNSNHGTSSVGTNSTSSASTNVTTGKFGNARTFNGIDQYITILNNASLNFPDNLTFAAWLNITGTDWGGLFSRAASFSTGWDILINPGVMDFRSSCLGGTDNFLATGLVSGNGWHHFVVTFDSASQKITTYRDGSFVASVPQSGKLCTTNSPNYIGTEIAVGGDPREFKGSMDDLRIYNRALTPGEVQALYNTVP